MERILVEGSSHYVGDNRGTRAEDDESSVVYQPMEVGVDGGLRRAKSGGGGYARGGASGVAALAWAQ